MKTKLISFSLLCSIIFSGCNGATSSSSNGDGNQIATSQSGNSVEVPADQDLQSVLAFGTLMLDETDFPVTPDQAKELLILWKTLGTLVQADNVTSEEIDAVYSQIQEVLTTDQLGAIDAMDFTDLADQFAAPPGGAGDFDEEARATQRAQFDNGDFSLPEGFTPGQGGGPGGDFEGGGFPPEGFTQGQGFDANGNGTPGDAPSGGGFPQDLFSLGFINRVIAFLEERAAE